MNSCKPDDRATIKGRVDSMLAESVIDDGRTTNLMAEEIDKAKLALRDAYSLLRSISVGGDDGELSRDDHIDAVHELIVARRALRHLARIVDGHADYLDGLAAHDQATAEAEPLIDPDCRASKCGSCVGGPCEHSCHETIPGGEQ
ncbi:hypothetical protein ACQEVF_25115 [Nonomuraea polychroma]|uniref:hypothetical protein n=1 Tax=Nonomuraea polychroma TaxID=46176 RepID=UPI003D8D0D4A